jgi:thiamine biosynthesis protein ThiS
MQLTINGQPKQVSPATTTAADLLTELEIKRERVAVVLNENVVRRADLENTTLTDGDTIEIITMVGGG